MVYYTLASGYSFPTYWRSSVLLVSLGGRVGCLDFSVSYYGDGFLEVGKAVRLLRAGLFICGRTLTYIWARL